MCHGATKKSWLLTDLISKKNLRGRSPLCNFRLSKILKTTKLSINALVAFENLSASAWGFGSEINSVKGQMPIPAGDPL